MSKKSPTITATALNAVVDYLEKKADDAEQRRDWDDFSAYKMVASELEDLIPIVSRKKK